MAKGEKTKKTGIRVFVVTVDKKTHIVLKTEEEDPNTGKRREIRRDVKSAVEAKAASGDLQIAGLSLAGFTPSVVVLVGTSAQSLHGALAATVKGLTAGAPAIPGPPTPIFIPPNPGPNPMPVQPHPNGDLGPGPDPDPGPGPGPGPGPNGGGDSGSATIKRRSRHRKPPKV